MKRICIIVLLVIAAACRNAAPVREDLRAGVLVNSTKARAEALLVQWTDALLKCQVKDGEDAGFLLCPACPDGHGRIIDMVWPLTWLWQRTGEVKYLDAARGAVSWGESHLQQPDGSYKNDIKSNWLGITEFSQIALGKTLLRFGKVLPEELKEQWRDLFDRQTEYIVGWISRPKRNLNVNYQAARPLCMELAYRITGEERFRKVALEQAELVVGHIAPDGLLFGESHPSEYLSPGGLRGVDMGYNVEESLPLLLEYAEMVEDRILLDKLLASADAHLEFILPDGGLDNSFGTRSNKWTWWGSRTSDGILSMLSALARNGRPEALRAAEYTLCLYDRCTCTDGLLAGGLFYEEAGEPACIHHTFCHIKPLPDWIDCDFSSISGDTVCPPLFSETQFGVKEFPSRGVHIIGTRDWRATVNNADNWFNRETQTTAGGSLSMLYHRRAGVILAGTSMVYRPDETLNMQWQKNDTLTRSFTPRIEDGAFSNVYDKNAMVKISGGKDCPIVEVDGVLADESGTSGAPFHITYTFKGNHVGIDIRGTGVFVLPVICTPDDDIRYSGRRMFIRRGCMTIGVRSSTGLVPTRTARPDGLAFTPTGGFVSPYLTIPLTDGKASVTLTVR